MPEEANNTDTTSFASILAGVQKLRGDAGGSTSTQAQNAPPTSQTQRPPVSSVPAKRPYEPQQRQYNQSQPQKRVNAFNQDKTRTSTTTTDPQRRGPAKPSAIMVNKTQTGNPLLKSINNVNWTFVESRNPYDYLVNNRNVLFLSLKYHKLHPEYLGNKMKPLLKKDAILLAVVDVESNEAILREINKMCLYNEFTLLLAFNFEQAAKYLVYLATTPSRINKSSAPPQT